MDAQTISMQLLMSLLGCFGFTIVFHVKKREWLISCLGGVMTWAVDLLVQHIFQNDFGAAFIGAVAASFYGELLARPLHAPATVFTVIAFLPLIPGASLYRAADTLMNGDLVKGTALSIYALLFAASMSAGIVITTLLFRKISGKYKIQS